MWFKIAIPYELHKENDMELIQIFKCKTCGHPLDEWVERSENGLVKCPSCQNVWTIPKKNLSSDALQYLHIGEHDLSTGKFEDAFSAYKKAAELDSSEPEAYFGMVLSKFKVFYLKDEVNNCLQPICFEITNKKITKDPNYLEALEKSTSDQRAVYEEKGKEIDEISSEFYKIKQTGLDYDCFICTKVTDENGNKTEDSDDAEYIYGYLKRKGYSPFYSEKEIRNKQGIDYEAHILYALYTSECMLIVCHNEEYLQTKWVKNEYSRFLKLLNEEEKDNDSITFVFSGTPIEKLPGRHGKIQGIDIKRREAEEQIIDFVENHTPQARKKREEAAAKKLEQENRWEETQKQFSEIQETMKNMKVDGHATIGTLMERANQEIEMGHFDKAVNFLEEILKIQPKNAEAWYGLFLCDLKVNGESSLQFNEDIIKKTISNANFQNARKYATGKSVIHMQQVTDKIKNYLFDNVETMKADIEKKDALKETVENETSHKISNSQENIKKIEAEIRDCEIKCHAIRRYRYWRSTIRKLLIVFFIIILLAFSAFIFAVYGTNTVQNYPEWFVWRIFKEGYKDVMNFDADVFAYQIEILVLFYSLGGLVNGLVYGAVFGGILCLILYLFLLFGNKKQDDYYSYDRRIFHLQQDIDQVKNTISNITSYQHRVLMEISQEQESIENKIDDFETYLEKLE